jgi:hypothetical protein
MEAIAQKGEKDEWWRLEEKVKVKVKVKVTACAIAAGLSKCM